MSKIIFSESGQGIPVVFLHGYCESKELWDQFSASLSSDYRVLTPDLPGHGKSPLPSGDLSLDGVADDLKEWLSGLDITECIMIGHSMGGYTTLAFAKKYPEMLKGLGLFHSSVFGDTEEKKSNRSKTIEFIQNHGLDQFLESFIPNLFFKDRHGELSEIIQNQIKQGKKTPAEGATGYMAAMRDRDDSSKFIQAFNKPVLMIIGEEDQSVPLEKSKKQADLLMHPTVHFLKNTAHMGMFEREKETLNFVKEFLKQF